MLIVCYTVIILYSQISGYINLIGGICSSVAGFIIPLLLFARTNRYERWHWKNVLTEIRFVAAGITIDYIKSFIGKKYVGNKSNA